MVIKTALHNVCAKPVFVISRSKIVTFKKSFLKRIIKCQHIGPKLPKSSLNVPKYLLILTYDILMFQIFSVNQLDAFLTRLRGHQKQEVIDQIRQLLHDQDKIQQMNNFVASKEAKSELSSRLEDPEWFQGKLILVFLSICLTNYCFRSIS